MGFVQAGFLTALAALAVPIIIHLVFGQRARRVDLGTLRFLKIALSQNVRRKRLKRWLLLALRMAAISLLALLFARPFLLALQHRGDDRLVVVLVDRSASMNLQGSQGRALDSAVAEARRILAAYDDAEVHLAFFDHTVHRAKIESGEWETPEVCSSTTDYGAAFNWAHDICLQSTRSQKEIHLLTDLQRSGLGRTPANPTPPDVRVHVVDLGAPYPRNAAVTRVTPSRLVVRPGERIHVSTTVFNAGQFAVKKLPLVLHLEHDQRQRNWRSQVDLEPGASDTIEFELPELDPGVWQGYVVAESEDELPFDNRRHLAVRVAPPLEVLMIDGDPTELPITSETYFLDAAVRLAPVGEVFPDSPYMPRIVPASPSESLPPLGQAAVVVLANVDTLSNPDARHLEQYVKAGGSLLIFTGDRSDPELLDRLATAGLRLGKITGPQPADALPWRLDTWDRQHPVFAPFSDPQYGDLRRLSFRSMTAMTPDAESKVLASFRDGSPVLVERRHGLGNVLWFASACDRDWSDWPRSRLYVPVVHQLLGYLTGLTEGGPIRLRDSDQFGPNEQLLEPGVYDRGDYHEIVTVDPRESETDRCSIADLAKQYRFTVADEAADSAAVPVSAGLVHRELRQDEVWHWVLLVLFALLLIEGTVANRTTV